MVGYKLRYRLPSNSTNWKWFETLSDAYEAKSPISLQIVPHNHFHCAITHKMLSLFIFRELRLTQTVPKFSSIVCLNSALSSLPLQFHYLASSSPCCFTRLALSLTFTPRHQPTTWSLRHDSCHPKGQTLQRPPKPPPAAPPPPQPPPTYQAS